MSKHTPGPWEMGRHLRDEESVGFITIEQSYEPGRHVASMGESDEDAANARLIAAAPEMLEELQNVIRQAEANPFLSVGMLLEHHSKIRAVIAKAERRDEPS